MVIWLDLAASGGDVPADTAHAQAPGAAPDPWNGNRERCTTCSQFYPEQSILVWPPTRHPIHRQRYD